MLSSLAKTLTTFIGWFLEDRLQKPFACIFRDFYAQPTACRRKRRYQAIREVYFGNVQPYRNAGQARSASRNYDVMKSRLIAELGRYT